MAWKANMEDPAHFNKGLPFTNFQGTYSTFLTSLHPVKGNGEKEEEKMCFCPIIQVILKQNDEIILTQTEMLCEWKG